VAFGVVNGLLIKGLAPRTVGGVARILTLPGDDESGNASVPEYERFVEATRDALEWGRRFASARTARR
jgi:hypothetical protein